MDSRQLMIRDGAPAALFLTPAQRAKAWAGRPLTTIPLFQAAPKDESDEIKVFRAQEEERRRLKSLASIGKMKARMETKKVDFSKVRWDARHNQFVSLEGGTTKLASVPVGSQHAGPLPKVTRQIPRPTHGPIWSRVNKDTARRLAELNGVWDDKYVKLSGGLLVMSITNRMKGLIKKGVELKWG